jgi:uncharacterized protein YutE (UPF0331/DUF86 family)
VAPPAVVDRDLVTRKLAMIVDDLRAVTPIAAKPLDESLASVTDEILTERELERMIGRMIDVNGLRNRIVHEYDDIDPRRVYEGRQAAVRDIPEYLRCVHQHVESSA